VANSTIPVILRVMAERDPGLAETLQQVERALAELAARAKQAGTSTGSIDQGLEDAAQAARRISAEAASAASAVRNVASAEKQASVEANGLAAAAGKAEAGLKGAEKASLGLLSSLKQVGMRSALGASFSALPAPAAAGMLKGAPSATMDARREAEKFSRVLEQVEQRYDQTARRAVEFGRTAGMAMMAAGAGVAALLGYSVQVAGQFEQLRAKLETVQKSALKAGETFDFARELAAKTPFDVQGVVTAAVQLEVYGSRAKEVLPVVADLAAGMGKRIEDTALAVGKALSGSLEGWESLRNEYGVSNARLAQYGATLSATGGISVATATDLDKARTALMRIIQTDFGGAVERQSMTLQGALSNAGDSVQNLAAAYGQTLVPVVTTAARTFSSLVDMASAIPAPLKAIVAMSAAAGAGVLLLGGGAVMATAGLVAMNAQLVAAAPNLAVAGLAAQRTTAALGLMGGAARGAGAAMAFLVTNPFGIALSAVVVGVGLASMALSSYEKSQMEAGQAIKQESADLQTVVQHWRDYRDAIEDASGASVDFRPNIREIADRLEDLRSNPSALVAEFQERNVSLQALKEQLSEASTKTEELRRNILLLQDVIGRRGPLGGDTAVSGVQSAFPEKGFLDEITVDDARKRLSEFNDEYLRLAGTQDILQAGIDAWQRLEDPLAKAAAEAKRLDGYLKFAGKSTDIRTMTEALEETRRTLAQLQEQASMADPGMPVADADALRERLLDPKLTQGQKDAIEGILTLMGEVGSQTDRINDANEKASNERLRLMDVEFDRSQAGRDEDLDATLAHLERKLQAVRGNAEQETQVLNQMQQVRDRIYRRDLESKKKSLQDAVGPAMQAAEDLASSGDATSAEVAQSYRGVMSLLMDWECAHRNLLAQVPELREEYARLRRDVSKKVQASEGKVPEEKLAALRQQTQEIQAAAIGEREKLDATRQSIAALQTALRVDTDLRGNAKTRSAIQKEINGLRRIEADLVEQLADKERQAAQQMQSLRLQVMDQSISGLESLMGGDIGSRLTAEQRASAIRDVLRAETAEEVAAIEQRLAAGVKAEEALAEARHKRFEEALRLLEMERDAELAAVGATESDKALAHEKFLARKRMLDEAERQRVLQGLRKEVADVQQAEKDKQAARYASERQARIGGEKSPILTPDEAFSYGAGKPRAGLDLGDFATREKAYYDGKGSRWASPEKGGADYWSDAAKRVATASESAGQGLDKIPPAADRVDVSATSLVDRFSALSTAAVQAAAALSTVKGGSKNGGFSSTGVPEGTTTDGKQFFAPGAGPEGAIPVDGSGYPVAPTLDGSGYPVAPTQEGYPGLMERRMPTPVEMGAVSPRAMAQSAVPSRQTQTHVEQRNTFNINPASPDPDIRAMEAAAARYLRRKEQRQGMLAGGWR